MIIQRLWMFLGLTTLAGAQGGLITCQSSQAELNKSVSVTFSLPQNAKKANGNFTVYHYNNKTFRNSVLTCSWKDGSNYCTVAKGYNFNWEITQTFVLNILSLSVAQTGFYACHLEGYEFKQIKPCRVTIRQVSAAHFQCSWKNNTMLCGQGFSFRLDVRKNFILDMRALFADTAGVFACTEASEINAKPVQGTTCFVYGSNLTSEASLRCNFAKDIRLEKKRVAVYRYTETSFPETVANCMWVNSEFQCISMPEYRWKKTVVRDHLTISVPRTIEGQTGAYACEVQGYDADQTRPCSDFILMDELEAEYNVVFTTTETVDLHHENARKGKSTEKIFSVFNGTDRPTTKTKQHTSASISATCILTLVAERSYGSVLCTFGDVMKDHSFVILHYSLNHTGVPDVPLMCLKTATGLECEVNEGYEYAIDINNFSAILRLPRVRSEDLGTYTCTSVMSNSGHGSCSLSHSAGSEETDTFFGRHKVFISGATGAITATVVTVAICVFIIYKRGQAKYERPCRTPDCNYDPYRKLPAIFHHENTRIVERNSIYEEVKDVSTSQRSPQRSPKLEKITSWWLPGSAVAAEDASCAVDTRNITSKCLTRDHVPLSPLCHNCGAQALNDNKSGYQVDDVAYRDMSDLPETSIRHDNDTPSQDEIIRSMQSSGNKRTHLRFQTERLSNEDFNQLTQREGFPRIVVVSLEEGKQCAPANIPALNSLESPLSPKQHFSKGITVRDSSCYKKGNSSPPSQSEYYLHPVTWTYSREDLRQSHDLANVILPVVGDAKKQDESNESHSVDGLSGGYLTPLNVSHKQFSASI